MVARLVVPALAAAALLACAGAAAQAYRPDLDLERLPAEAMSLSPAAIQALNEQLGGEYRSLDAFGSGKRGVDRFSPSSSTRPGPWVFYGRMGILNFQNQLGEQPLADSRITWRRTGPSIAGRYYIGLQKRF